MNEKFGIITETTSAESPWSNGIVERYHALLFEAMLKTKEETGCDVKTALAWATAAKNALYNDTVTFHFSQLKPPIFFLAYCDASFASFTRSICDFSFRQ